MIIITPCQALFDNTCALREKRLDIEELMAEEKKTAEALKKETDALIKKQKIIENNLKTAEADLEQFQVSVCRLGVSDN